MSSLILNFDWDSSAKDSIHPQSKQTVGSWTQKLKQKKLAKHRQKLRNKDAPLPIEDDSQPDLQQQQPEEYHPASQPQTAPRKKLKLDATASQPTPSRFQIISSLFSSTIIPTIKPNPNHEPSSMVVYAPSNASLSQIKITSPSLNLHPQISEQLHSSPKLGSIHSPTSIQSIAWPLLSSQSNHSNRDVIIQSETGSGKTLAYLVPIIQDLLTLPLNRPEVSWNREIGTLAIILVPTRELAEQVYHVAINLLSFTQKNRSDPENLVDATCAPEYAQEESPGSKTRPFRLNPRWLVPGTLHGGTNRSHEKARLRRGLPLLVCTPGRLLDHLEKTVSLRMAGETKNVPTTNRTKSNSESVASNLKLRWLVVDEADRLMDMGFEEQMSGILKHLKQRETNKQDANSTPIASHPNSHSRRTILCSATIPDGVKKLVGMSLNDPILLKATGPPSSEQEPTQANNDSTQESVDQSDNNAKFAAPSQLSQYYVITPSKLRLVSLIALLRQITSPHQKKPAEKILVFMSCTASVDFHFEAIGNILTNDDDEHAENQKNAHDDGKNKRVKTDPRKPASSTTSQVNRSPILRKSNLIPGVNIYRLHGSLDLQTRLKSLNKFSDKTQGSAKTNSDRETRVANPSILFCTSLAGRGLDVPFVSHVIQYDLPTEGGVTEYLHRIGRTARAGLTGQAWSFLLPTESGWIDWCEANQNHHQDHTSTHHRVPKLKQIDVQNLLSEGFAAKSQKEWEARATDTQMSIEKWVLQSEKNRNLASIGFMSHIRAYTTHPTKEKMFFNLKNLHLGHLAKSFGLREPPKNLSSYGTTTKNNSTPASDNKRVNKRKNDTQDLQTMISDDDDEDFDNSKLIKKPINFFPLTQSIKTSHSLKGPLGNSIDEFNLG